MSRYKAIIFDCDGVLVDSEPLSNQVLVDMANELGASIDLEYAYRNFKGNALKNCMIQISEIIGKSVPHSFEADFRKRSFKKFKNEILPVDGVLNVVKNLKVPFCVASSGPENKIRLNLKLTGLLPYFESKIFSCYAIQKWKPDPAVFLWASETMGFKPNECLVIEDSVLGVQAAIDGGFNVFGYTEHDYIRELDKLGIRTFAKMHDLFEIIS